MNSPLLDVLAIPDRADRRDQLSDLIVRVRRGAHSLSLEEADALDREIDQESRREPFDVAMYDRIWDLLVYCPPRESIRNLCLYLLENLKMGYRGQAMRYLLRAYPEDAPALKEKYDKDPAHYVQDAIASAEVAANPGAAVKRWEGILCGRDLTQELAEVLPFSIAYALPEENLEKSLREYDAFDRRAGGGSVWGLVAGAIRQRLAPKR